MFRRRKQTQEELNERFISAARIGNIKELDSLIAQGVSKDAVDVYGNNAALNAAWNGQQEMYAYLIKEHGFSRDAVSKYGNNAALNAAANGRQEMYAYLIKEHGFSRDSVSKVGDNALTLASYFGKKAMVMALVEEYGFDLSFKGDEGLTGEEWARKQGHAEIANYLEGKAKHEQEAARREQARQEGAERRSAERQARRAEEPARQKEVKRQAEEEARREQARRERVERARQEEAKRQAEEEARREQTRRERAERARREAQRRERARAEQAEEARRKKEEEKQEIANSRANTDLNKMIGTSIHELKRASALLDGLDQKSGRRHDVLKQQVIEQINTIISACLNGKPMGGGRTGRDRLEPSPDWLKDPNNKKLMEGFCQQVGKNLDNLIKNEKPAMQR